MKILHSESSKGWGGQEMRILREAIAMRQRGHEIFLAVNRGGKLIEKARSEGFCVYECDFSKRSAPNCIYKLYKILKECAIDVLNTHSSLDAWLGGIAARLAGVPIIRTRHLSTPIRSGLNSYLLYNKLVDFVVTTCSCILVQIEQQAKLDRGQLQCIPTGIDPRSLSVNPAHIAQFRSSLGLAEEDILVGTACFVRSWKGIDTLLKTAQLLHKEVRIKWVIVGGGHVDDYRPKLRALDLEKSVVFTGHLENPFSAIAAMDIFLLLSTAHEGISQASLQAAYLKRPLITTPIGGLPEICIPGKTGFLVSPFSPEQTAEAILALAKNARLRSEMGAKARLLVQERFTFQQTIDGMESVCLTLSKKSDKKNPRSGKLQ
ncbi:MAG TPA: glycosyltransferase [Rhabdochlamydiaceae bacterium]|jgi:glycosyltransferase involved in cell wall biosynthesis